MSNTIWRESLKPYAKPSAWRASFQMLNTVVPYIILLFLTGFALYQRVPYFLVLILALLTGGFMVRTFILFHDCTHLSFVKSKTANHIIGYLLGVLTFTPYAVWQAEHNKHHGTVGNLDSRGVGDVWTMTVQEYQSSKTIVKAIYRLYRNPLFLFLVAPFFLFGVINRFPASWNMSRSEHVSLAFTNIAIFAIAGVIIAKFGVVFYLMFQLPILFFASVMGVWLFYVQHQFEDVYWQKNEQWNFVKAALEGSSFYKLPLVLEWISGYIGYHHIHHLNPRIPNYYLKKCYQEIHSFGTPHTITFFQSFKLALLHLYDEQSGKLVSFSILKKNSLQV